MDSHSRAWELIQKRQDYLDNLEAQAGMRRAELKKLSKEIKQYTYNRDELFDELVRQAEETLLQDRAELVRSKYRLRFEVTELEKKHQELTSNIEFAWAEHDDLLKTTSHLNQEVSAMMVEVKSETTRGEAILKDLDGQVKTLLEQRDGLNDEITDLHKQRKNLQAELAKDQDIRAKETDNYKTRLQRYNEQITQNKRQLGDTYTKLYKALDQLKDISTKDKTMREAIADQRLGLEKEKIKTRKTVNSDLLEL